MPDLNEALAKQRALAEAPTLGNLHPDARAQAIARAAMESPAYGVIDPDYARVFTQARIIAWQYGFACVMYGSFTRDLDLLLVPWEDRANDGIVVPILKQIAASCDLQMYIEHGEPRVTQKPHGRKAYTLHFPGFHDRRWVDVSVLPCASKGSAAGNAEYDSWASNAGVPASRSDPTPPRGNDGGERV